MRDYFKETDELKNLCRVLLQSTDCIIAWTGSMMRPKPSVITSENLESIVWSPFCTSSTATYLKKHRKDLFQKKIGVVVKDCELRALNVMFQENIFDRKNVVTVGVRCDGIADALHFDVDAPVSIKSDDRFVYVDEKKVMWEDFGITCCSTCAYSDMGADYTVGMYLREKKNDWHHLSKIKNMSYAERRKYFSEMAEKCIRCYACREVCPVCTCMECAADPLERMISPRTTPREKTVRPVWIFREKNAPENALYLLTRAIHMSGRCVRCGSCENACPVGLPLMNLIDIVNETVIEKYDYVPGEKPDAKPFIAFYSENDYDDNMEGFG